MINYLPLHEDFVEHLTIYRCLEYLYEIGNPYMVSLAEPVIKASLIILSDKRKYYENGNKVFYFDNVYFLNSIGLWFFIIDQIFNFLLPYPYLSP